jgi:hypothetical protein
MKIPVEGQPGLYRDSESGAIVNISDIEFDSYQRTKELKLKEKNEIDILKNDVSEIKDMMKLILSKLEPNS